MGATRIGKLDYRRLPRERRLSVSHSEGLVLLDSSLKPLGFDRGAAAILNDSDQSGLDPQLALPLPKEIVEAINGSPSPTPLTRRIAFRIGSRSYSCRIYVVEAQSGRLPERVVVLHLARELSVADSLSKVSYEYKLTGREEETLHGVVMGLTSKEVAERMNISPNTVKAFLRLIMGKMGVTTRAGLVAKLLEHYGGG